MPPFALFFLTRFPSLFSPSQLFIFASIAFFKINNLSVFHILDHCPIPSFSFLFSHVTCNPHCAAKLLFGLIVIVALYSILAPLHFWSVLKLFIFQMSRPRSQLSLPYVLPRIRKTIVSISFEIAKFLWYHYPPSRVREKRRLSHFHFLSSPALCSDCW